MAVRAGDIPFKTDKPADVLKAKASFLKLGEGHYELAFPDMGLVFTASHVNRGREHQLTGELKVTADLKGARLVDGVLSIGHMNFSSQRGRTEHANHLSKRSGTESIDWQGALDLLSYRIIQAEQQGDPIRPLVEYDEPLAETEWEVAGIPLLQQHPMILFGDGGSAKSYIALWIAAQLAQNGVSVLYADWEFSPQEHRRRLRLLSRGAMPATLFYVRCHQPLVDEASRLQAFIAKQRIQYIICDSIAFAVPGRPEDAEHAGGYFRAVRSLGIGSLHLAHVTKSGLDTPDPDKPFGSVFWSNGARSTWFVKRADIGVEDATQIEVALYHRKTNTSKRHGAKGLRLRFLDTQTLVEPFDVAENTELAAKLPVWQRMQKALKRGPLSVQEIAERIEAPEDTVRKTAKRMTIFVKLNDGSLALSDEPKNGF